MSHSVKIYDTCIGCTQCVRACPTDVLEMIPWDGCKAKQIASAPRTEDCVGCKRCESACPTKCLPFYCIFWHVSYQELVAFNYFFESNNPGIVFTTALGSKRADQGALQTEAMERALQSCITSLKVIYMVNLEWLVVINYN